MTIIIGKPPYFIWDFGLRIADLIRRKGGQNAIKLNMNLIQTHKNFLQRHCEPEGRGNLILYEIASLRSQ